MISGTPVEQVADYLEVHGYRRMKSPLKISGVTFDVSAALIGADKSTDLILVADTAFEKNENILRVVKAIARALDVARSSRPLTTIIVGPPPNTATHESLARVCRVLAIGRIDGGRAKQVFKNWLAVLTPLNISDPSSIIADPIAELEDGLVDEVGQELVTLVDVAVQGSHAVKQRLNELLGAKLQYASTNVDVGVQQEDATSAKEPEQDLQPLGDPEE